MDWWLESWTDIQWSKQSKMSSGGKYLNVCSTFFRIHLTFLYIQKIFYNNMFGTGIKKKGCVNTFTHSQDVCWALTVHRVLWDRTGADGDPRAVAWYALWVSFPRAENCHCPFSWGTPETKKSTQVFQGTDLKKEVTGASEVGEQPSGQMRFGLG